MNRVIILLSLLAGGGDLFTGLLLVLAPEVALQWMHVPPVTDVVWVQFVGVFVGCVGWSYLQGVISLETDRTRSELRTIWKITAVIRLVVAAFVLREIALGQMDRAWLRVPLVDLFWAAIQVGILIRAFPKE